MTIDDVKPGHCYARANRLLGEIASIREVMGRTSDARPDPQITGAQPRDCYFEAIATWRKADRLGHELGVRSVKPAPAMPALGAIRPGHVAELIDAVLAQVDEIKQRLHIAERSSEPAVEPDRQPSDVLRLLVRANRALSRVLETPFTPSDVHHTVALALAYASRLGARGAAATFDRGKQPADCYHQLERCLDATKSLLAKKSQPALSVHGMPDDVLPGDVYDLSYLVLGQVAFLHSLAPTAEPVLTVEPGANGHRLPSHVDQAARTLAAQLATL
jgi:hypothetical protein